MKILGMVVFAAFLTLAAAPSDAAAQISCDSCQDAPWGKACLLDDPGGTMSGCHQHAPDHCDFTGTCEPEFAVLDTSVGGSLAISEYVMVATEATGGNLRRSCDLAITLRAASTRDVADKLEKVTRITI